MSDTKWAKGPWRYERDCDGFAIIAMQEKATRYGVKGEWEVACVGDDAFWDIVGQEEKDRANAHLIAAAPDMAGVCKLIKREDVDLLANALRAAIGADEYSKSCISSAVARLKMAALKSEKALSKAKGESNDP